MPEHSLATLQTTCKTAVVDEVQEWLKDIREQAQTVLAYCEEDEETKVGNVDLCEGEFMGGSKEGKRSKHYISSDESDEGEDEEDGKEEEERKDEEDGKDVDEEQQKDSIATSNETRNVKEGYFDTSDLAGKL